MGNAGGFPPSRGRPGGDGTEPPAARAVDATKIYGSGDTAVVALDDVTVDVPAGPATPPSWARRGPASRRSCTAWPGSTRSPPGQVFVGDQDLGDLSEDELTLLRRDRIGFVFQAYNLVPTLTALENITLPLSLAGRKPDRVARPGGDDDRARRPAHPPAERAVGRPAAAGGRGPGPGQPAGDHLRRRAHRQPRLRAGAEILDFMRRAVREMGQTIVMVTHDPVAAAYADTAVFLADGQIVDTMEDPTAERVLDRLKQFGE